MEEAEQQNGTKAGEGEGGEEGEGEKEGRREEKPKWKQSKATENAKVMIVQGKGTIDCQ